MIPFNPFMAVAISSVSGGEVSQAQYLDIFPRRVYQLHGALRHGGGPTRFLPLHGVHFVLVRLTTGGRSFFLSIGLHCLPIVPAGPVG